MEFKYAIGEILIFQRARFEPELNGLECLVMGYRAACMDQATMQPESGAFYAIEFQDGRRRSALEINCVGTTSHRRATPLHAMPISPLRSMRERRAV